jgi:molybdate transport system ATP-binding protein
VSLELDVSHRAGGFTLTARLSVGPGVTALYGPSGSGKTTLVNIVAGLVRPDQGRVVCDGRVLLDSAAGIWVPPHRRRIGYVFQDARLFPHLRVRANLGYGRRLAGLAADRQGFAEVVELLGLGGLLERQPAGLSGGEKQRVAIGRALLSGPRLLLMDEPLSGLDEDRKAEILPYLERLRDQLRVPMVYVSHSLAEVARLANHVAVLGTGTLRAVGPVSEILASPGLLSADGPEEGSVLEAVVGPCLPGHALTTLQTPAGPLLVPAVAAAEGTRLRIRVRARDVLVATAAPDGLSALNVLPGRVDTVGAAGGGAVEVVIACGAARLLARITTLSAERLGLVPGRSVWAIVKAVAFDGQAVARGR